MVISDSGLLFGHPVCNGVKQGGLLNPVLFYISLGCWRHWMQLV